MFDDFFQKPHRRHVKDLNLVPIIDMFTTVVFFLLLSANFEHYSKITVPPSASVSIVVPEDGPPPLAPKLVLLKNSETELELLLTWEGEKPGEISEKIRVTRGSERPAIMQGAKKIVEQFVKTHSSEKALQVGLENDLDYQSLVSVLDAVQGTMPNVVLISYSGATEGGK